MIASHIDIMSLIDGSQILVYSYKCEYGNSKRVVWNFPMEALFKSLNPHGWPKIVLNCHAKDFLGREYICAYGCTNIPVSPGRHERTVQMFSPVSSSWIARLFAYLSGKSAEYINPIKALADNEGREVTRVKPEGIVKMVFQITTRNMDKLGYAT